VYELSTVLQARTPDLSPKKQAILAYANLKMQSNDFSSYLRGKQAASDVYGKVWVGSTRDGDQNQLAKRYKRSVKSNHAFFGLAPISTIPGLTYFVADFRSESPTEETLICSFHFCV
jgi:hypothetical protein